MVQWLRIRLPVQGIRVQALVREDPTCRGATEPVRHNYWAHEPQLLKPACLEPMLRNKRSHCNEKPVHRNECVTLDKLLSLPELPRLGWVNNRAVRLNEIMTKRFFDTVLGKELALHKGGLLLFRMDGNGARGDSVTWVVTTSMLVAGEWQQNNTANAMHAFICRVIPLMDGGFF